MGPDTFFRKQVYTENPDQKKYLTRREMALT